MWFWFTQEERRRGDPRRRRTQTRPAANLALFLDASAASWLQYIANGRTQEAAFHTAVHRLGSPEILRAKFTMSKTGILSKLCVLEDRSIALLPSVTFRQAGALQIVVALVFATSMIISSQLLCGKGYAGLVRNILLAIYLFPFTALSVAGSKQSRACR